MPKYYSTARYRDSNKRRLLAAFVRKIKRQNVLKTRKKLTGSVINYSIPGKIATSFKGSVFAPADFRLLENTDQCLKLFRDIRSASHLSSRGSVKYVDMSMKFITQIDYATISVLTAISDDLKFKGIVLQGDFPDDPDCRRFMTDSGFLNHMVGSNGKPFKKAPKSDLIFFEKGSGELSRAENIKISNLVKNVVKHLTQQEKYFLPVKTIILEICGNSIEWAETGNNQWLLGVQYLDDKVILTVSDVGKGILETLNRKYSQMLKDVFTLKSPDQILFGAFEKKYGSSTGEANRNKGLPSVKANFDKGTISALKVLSNNVLLHFDNASKSNTFPTGASRFKGTFYQWEMTKECLTKLL